MWSVSSARSNRSTTLSRLACSTAEMNGNASRRVCVLAESDEATSTWRSPVTAAKRRKLPVATMRSISGEASRIAVRSGSSRLHARPSGMRGRVTEACAMPARARSSSAGSREAASSASPRRSHNWPSEVSPVTRCSSATSVTPRLPLAASRAEILRHLGQRFFKSRFRAEVSNARQRLAHRPRVGVGRVGLPRRQARGNAREIGSLGMPSAHRGNCRHQ